jgi:hypothetical protein
MTPRAVTPPAPILEQYLGGLSGAERVNSLAQAQMAGSSDLTKTYQSQLNNFNRASGGLSAKGKYSGFFSAGDQQSAIEGAARGIKDSAKTYRAKADAFINKLDSIYGEASKGPSRVFISQGMSQLPSVDERKWGEINPNGYINKIVNPSRRYANQLNDWYVKQSPPAVDYRATADQIDTTPISSLATRIATSAYGMNPDLAAGKFIGLDKTYFAEQEDAAAQAVIQKEANKLGIPAAEYKSYKETEAANAKITAGYPKQYQTLVEKTTRFKASDLESATNQTSEQLYSSFASQFDFTDPDTSTPTVANGAGVISKLRKYIDSGDAKSANNLITNIAASQSKGQQQLVRILTAMFKLGITNTGKQTQANSMYVEP